MLSSKLDAPKVVAIPATSKLSFAVKGIPWRGPLDLPACLSRSSARASSNASRFLHGDAISLDNPALCTICPGDQTLKRFFETFPLGNSTWDAHNGRHWFPSPDVLH